MRLSTADHQTSLAVARLKAGLRVAKSKKKRAELAQRIASFVAAAAEFNNDHSPYAAAFEDHDAATAHVALNFRHDCPHLSDEASL